MRHIASNVVVIYVNDRGLLYNMFQVNIQTKYKTQNGFSLLRQLALSLQQKKTRESFVGITGREHEAQLFPSRYI